MTVPLPPGVPESYAETWATIVAAFCQGVALQEMQKADAGVALNESAVRTAEPAPPQQDAPATRKKREATCRREKATAKRQAAASPKASARPQRRPSATVPTTGATIVAKAEAQQLAALARPATPAAADRPVVTVQAAVRRGRVASDFPNADAFLLAPPPGGKGARMFAALLRLRAGALPSATGLDDGGDDQRAMALAAQRRLKVCAAQDLLALADLYDHCSTLYPEVQVPPTDGLPINGDALRAAVARASGSSPALACMEV
ncbi:hypothetical protein [Methylobacterium nodulans]|uniref:Uncharacterized protein n=1 Tax=Methylobacterium nodulans (strain LMG 21967 / CNCM I-2342 / ORS 2060) TaxID=460265 RepID=B8IDS8_METNO|nr:hypothetical protein [Methylobacterium nodulans]ACL55650.1 hypothetical protein Mnod_0614 [Methylobacterium nodulans ORS 2060]